MRRSVFAIALAFVLVNLIGLDRSPVVWMDEVTLNDPARVWASTGTLRSSVYADSAGFEHGYFWQPPGQVLVTSAVYRMFGFGIWQTRLPGVLFAGAALVLLALIARHMAGSALAGIAAAVIFACDPQLQQTARSGRMDAQCLVLALGGMLLYLRSTEQADPRRWLRLAGSGLMVGAAGVTHPVAVAWALGIGASMLLFDKDAMRRVPLFALSSAIPLLLWLLSAGIAGQWDLFISQFIEHGAGHTATGSVVQRIVDEAARATSRYRLAPLLLVLYVTAIGWCANAARTHAAWRRGLAVIFVLLVFVTLFMSKADAGFYLLPPMAMAAVAAGGMVASLRAHAAWTIRLRLAAAAIVLCVANGAAAGIGARFAALAFQWQARSYAPVQLAVAGAIGRGAVVWGREESWYALSRVDAELRVTGRPDPNRHAFAIIRPESASVLPPTARLVATVNAPLPPLFGRIVLPSQDYRLQIWRLR